ncbi:MAG TPA: tetratricopeptide repeat protein [Polyangiaceae bacterium]|nr:tetratricopeptide repeat protein [Polyangiaceae bacterium]
MSELGSPNDSSGLVTGADAQPAPVEPRPGWRDVRGWAGSIATYFREQPPTFVNALPPAIVVAVILFVRSPLSNHIFDEQEALLANPFVNSDEFAYRDAFKRDFWGLPPDRSIGSYRPLPNLIWKLLFNLSDRPFLHHLVNVFGHALNAALIASLAFALTRQRSIGWLSGGAFLCAAVLTEAVTGVVGIADVLGGLGVLLALSALRLNWYLAPLGVFLGLVVGLFSKESAIVGVPLVAWAALVFAPALHAARPLRGLRAVTVFVAAVLALVAYTTLRKKFFPVSLPAELTQPLAEGAPIYRRGLHAFLRWFQQPSLPHDPINNPLVDADLPHRIAGALRVYFRGLAQVVLPVSLSGDYSFPQEPIPPKLVFPESVLGGLLLVVPPLAAPVVWLSAWLRERRERRAGTFLVAPSLRFAALTLLAVALIWIPVAYFPHSNIPVLLPTVRAERFWYLPCVGTSLVIALVAQRLLTLGRAQFGYGIVIGWFCIQAGMARFHAVHYTDDLIFWRATKNAVPNSAKAHLNYSVMVGARGGLDERLVANRRALELAPQWPMAHVYLGDTLCRMHKKDAAWPHYEKGFDLAPNDPNLIALGLQCLWEEKGIEEHREALLDMAERHPGSWLAFLATDIVHNGKEHNGVQPKYRPRAYNEGPKNE